MAKNKAKKSPPPLPARALTLLRIAFNWTQATVAEATGRTPQAISDLEQGATRLDREGLVDLLRPLGAIRADVDAAFRFLDRIEGRSGHPELSGPAGFDLGELKEQAAEAVETAVDTVVARVLTAATAAGERRLAEINWPLLRRSKNPRKRQEMVTKTTEYRGWALAERVCQESRRQAAHDPKEALELAELALAIAELTPGEMAWSWRVQGYALCTVANAWRVAGHLPEARQAWDAGKRLWQAGAAADPGLLDEIQIQSLEVSLLTSERQYKEALGLADTALETAGGEQVVDLLIKKANILELQGEHRAAIALLRGVEARLGQDTAPRKLYAHRYSLMNNLCFLGEAQEAARLLSEGRRLAEMLGNTVDQIRFKGLEGRIAAGLGKWEEAAHLLSATRLELESEGMLYDSALVTLELAAVYLELRRIEEVKELAAGLVPVFEQQGVPEESRKALTLFCQAVEREIATAELARQIAAFLYRAQHDPRLHFEVPR